MTYHLWVLQPFFFCIICGWFGNAVQKIFTPVLYPKYNILAKFCLSFLLDADTAALWIIWHHRRCMMNSLYNSDLKSQQKSQYSSVSSSCLSIITFTPKWWGYWKISKLFFIIVHSRGKRYPFIKRFVEWKVPRWKHKWENKNNEIMVKKEKLQVRFFF